MNNYLTHAWAAALLMISFLFAAEVSAEGHEACPLGFDECVDMTDNDATNVLTGYTEGVMVERVSTTKFIVRFRQMSWSNQEIMYPEWVFEYQDDFLFVDGGVPKSMNEKTVLITGNNCWKLGILDKRGIALNNYLARPKHIPDILKNLRYTMDKTYHNPCGNWSINDGPANWNNYTQGGN